MTESPALTRDWAAISDAARALRVAAERAAHGLDVLVWCPRLSPGGGARLLLSLVPALARDERVHSVRLAVPPSALGVGAKAWLNDAGVAVVELAPQFRDGVRRSELVHAHGDRVVAVAGSRDWQNEVATELARRTDVVYAFWAHDGPPPRTGRPLVATIQDTTLIDYPEMAGDKWGIERTRTAEWIERSAAIVVSSRATRSCLERLYGATGSAAVVIHHAIRPDVTAPAARLPWQLRRRLPDRYVLFAGNAGTQKNLDLALRAWARFDDRCAWPLVVIGYATQAIQGFDDDAHVGWRERQLGGLAARLGLGPDQGVIGLGFVRDEWVGSLIAGAAGLVMPSLNEGGGSFPVEEALAVGTPVLCSDIPVMREHLAQRTATIGWFDPESVDSLLGALHALVADYDVRQASAIAGRADPRPSWDDVAARYVDVFADVVARESVEI